MAERPNNPSAFPVSTIDGFTAEGMTLRDWFAGQAILAFGAYPDNTDQRARDAYALADAMLAERDRAVGTPS